MEWLPAASVDVANEAAPPATVTVPSTVAPSLNCTVPVAPVGATVTLKVTDCPATAGFCEELRAALELALETVTAAAGEVLATS